MSQRACITALAALLIILPATSDTIHVPGEIPSIQAGIMVAEPGDTVLIACGYYQTWMINMDSGITLRSETGDPSCVIVDAWNQGNALICYELSGAPTIIEGITIKGGVANDGGGATIWRCEDLVFRDCVFEENSALLGGAVAIDDSHARFEGCTFWSNAAELGGAVADINGSADFRNCSFYGNSSNLGAAVNLHEGDDYSFENCIFMHNTGSEAILCESAPQMECCDLFGNPDGNWIGPLAELLGVDGNIGLDPLFCYPESGDFGLWEGSPCGPHTPPNPDCDLIGAWPVSCLGPTSAPEVRENLPWGELKRRFY